MSRESVQRTWTQQGSVPRPSAVADTFGAAAPAADFSNRRPLRCPPPSAIGRLGTVSPVTPTVRTEAPVWARFWRPRADPPLSRRERVAKAATSSVLCHLMPARDLMFLRECGQILAGQFSERRKRHSGCEVKPRILDVKKCPSLTIGQRERPANVISRGQAQMAIRAGNQSEANAERKLMIEMVSPSLGFSKPRSVLANSTGEKDGTGRHGIYLNSLQTN